MARPIRQQDILDPGAALDDTGSAAERAARRLFLWHHGAFAGALADFTPGDLTGLSPGDRLRHGAIAAEAGQMDLALALTRQALAEEHDIFARHGFAGLLDSVAPYDPAIRDRHAGLLEKTAAWRQGFGEFGQLVQDPATRICVVGNAPNLAGQKHGALIDDHDLVIRFNNFRTGGQLAADTGHRTDIWVRTAQAHALWRRDSARFRCAVIAGHPAYWRSPAGLKVALDAARTGLAHDVIDPFLYADIVAQLGAKPSNGLATLGWLRALRGSLAGITVLGFALDDQPPGEARRYFEDPPRKTAVPHDWPAERRLLDAWLTSP